MGVDLVSDGVKPYKVNDRAINHAVELKHGKSIKVFNMDRISNSPFTDVRLFHIFKPSVPPFLTLMMTARIRPPIPDV